MRDIISCSGRFSTPPPVTIFMALSPVSATIFGGLFLLEKISACFIVGLARVALGLILAHLRGEPQEP